MTTPPCKQKVKYVSEETKAFRKKINRKYPSCHGYNPDTDRECPPLDEINDWLIKNKITSKKPSISKMPNHWECRTCIFLDE